MFYRSLVFLHIRQAETLRFFFELSFQICLYSETFWVVEIVSPAKAEDMFVRFPVE